MNSNLQHHFINKNHILFLSSFLYYSTPLQRIPLAASYRAFPSRSMFKSTKEIVSKGVLINNCRQPIVKRGYAGEYSGHRWKVNPVEAKKLGLESYEQNHLNIVDNKTGLVKRLLTSSKGVKYNNFEKLSTVKYNGDFIPLINKITGKPVVDDYGNYVPDPNKGGQYLAQYETPRRVAGDVRRKFIKDETVQKYLDENEDKIQKSINKDIPKMSKNIGGQDDE